MGTTESRGTRLRALALVALGALVVAGLGTQAEASPRAATGDDPGALGSFSQPFQEPTILGKATNKKCITVKDKNGSHLECKPAAGSMAILTNGKILYWNALEGTENVKNGVAVEFGKVSVNDQARLLDIGGAHPHWSVPTPKDAGAQDKPDPLIPQASSTEKYNDGALFCSDLNFLADGRVIATGGTLYFNDPGPDTSPYGVAELQGLRNARIYDPATNRWTQTGSMHYGRWYPTMVTLGDGKIFIASGVRKLIKPIYPDSPSDSGTNVKQTETFDPRRGKWTYNGASADQSLPLFPRLSLLPDGHVFYNSAGQDFNPSGQSYDEPVWNFASSYDPTKKAWTNLGVPGVGTLTPGFRGSSFSIMQPLVPDEKDNYTSASFLSAGGVLGTTPGSYLAVQTSALTTVDTSGGTESMTTAATGDLAEPRWYSTAVLLPTGQTIAFNGANRDEVVGPGTGFPVQDAELYDPTSKSWTPVANSHDARTYHNTAALLPDGRVLVGGHAPISTLYGSNMTLPGGFSPNDGRDPSFEIYSPPYMFWGPRPHIRQAPSKLGYGQQIAITTDVDTSSIDSVVLVRNTSLTHLVDGDQRSVVLPVIARAGHTIVVKTPPNGNVAPAGPYLLFVNEKTDKGLVPSPAEQTFLEP